MKRWIWGLRAAMLFGFATTLVGCTLPARLGQGQPAALAAAATPGSGTGQRGGRQGGTPQGGAQGAGNQGGGRQGGGQPNGTPQSGAQGGGSQNGSRQGGQTGNRAGGSGFAGARVVPVEVTKATTGTMSLVFSYAGTLQAKDAVKIAPVVSGPVDKVLAKVGDNLKAGDPIAQIDQTMFQAQLAAAQAAYNGAEQKLVRMQIGSRPEEIAAAQAAVQSAQVAVDSLTTPTNDQRTVAAANMAKAQSALQQAQHDYDKIAYSGSAGSSSQATALQQATITYQSAVAAYNLTISPTDGQLAPLQNSLAQAQLKLTLTKQPYLDSDLAQAQATVDQAKAQLDLAKANVGFTSIRAPFDGIVAEVYISKGTLVGPSSPVVTFISTNEEVALDVEEARISQIKNGQYASLRVSAYPGKDFAAVVTSVAPMADTRSHSFQIKVTPADSENLLRSGMYADVQILANQKQDVVVVPLIAVTPLNNQSIVYVVNKDNTAEARTVTIGMSDQNQVEITSGVQVGENVVTAGQSNLSNGARVQIARGG